MPPKLSTESTHRAANTFPSTQQSIFNAPVTGRAPAPKRILQRSEVNFLTQVSPAPSPPVPPHAHPRPEINEPTASSQVEILNNECRKLTQKIASLEENEKKRQEREAYREHLYANLQIESEVIQIERQNLYRENLSLKAIIRGHAPHLEANQTLQTENAALKTEVEALKQWLIRATEQKTRELTEQASSINEQLQNTQRELSALRDKVAMPLLASQSMLTSTENATPRSVPAAPVPLK